MRNGWTVRIYQTLSYSKATKTLDTFLSFQLKGTIGINTSSRIMGKHEPFLVKYYEFFAGFALEVLNLCKKDDKAQPRLKATDALKWYETLVPEKERKKIDKQLEKEEEKRRKEEEK